MLELHMHVLIGLSVFLFSTNANIVVQIYRSSSKIKTQMTDY